MTNNKLSGRCCRTCKHCSLHILRGYECTANDNLVVPILDDADLNKNRKNCKAYVRG